MIRAITILWMLLCVQTTFFGQDLQPEQSFIQQTDRFEKEIKYSEDDFMVIPLFEDGIALVRDKQKFKSGNKTWELILLNDSLKVAHELELELEQRKNMIGFDYVPGQLFMLFRVPDMQRSSLEVVSIELSNAEIKKYEIQPELTFQLTHFNVVGSNFLFGGYVTNEPTVLLYNTSGENLKVLPGFFQKQTELIDLRPNQNQTFNAILVDRSDRDQRKLIFKTFDLNGVELLEDVSQIEEKYVLQTGISSGLVRDDLIITGTWGLRNQRQSLGLYTIPVNPFTEHKVKYIPYGGLSHFLDYLNPKRAARIKTRTKDAIQVQKLPDFSSYVVPYRLEENQEGYVLLIEVFNPSSSSSYNRYPMDYPMGYYPYPMYYSPFWGYYPGMFNRMYNPFAMSNSSTRSNDEVKMTQSVVVAFDNQGDVLWDYSVNLNDVRMPSLEQVSDFYIENGALYVIYKKKDSELLVKKITLKTGEGEETIEKIKLLNEGDEFRSEDRNYGSVRYWYGRNFYVWGQHSVRNRTTREEGSRQVFFINKVAIH